MIPTEAARFLLASENVRAMEEGKKPFSDTALHIWKTKYVAEGEISPENTAIRVAASIRKGDEKNYEIYQALYTLLFNRVVAFNSPVYFNLGVKESPQCSACFILGVDDTMESLAELGSNEMSIFRQGSGSGVNYSALRSNGAPLSNGGKASGPVSFMKALDTMAGVVKSGGRRRAARIAILDSNHPDIWDFIDCKVIEEKRLRVLAEAGELPADHFDNPAAFFQNTNHTVRLFDHDMEENKKLIQHIAEAIWECGDPGVHFADTVKKGLSNHPDVSELVHSTNPCSEFIFLDNSACNLASINVAHRFFDGEAAGNRLEAVAKIMAYVMDRIVDISSYPTKEIEENSKKYRPLGLGITGFAERCLNDGVVYGSEDCCDAISLIMQSIQTAAKDTCPGSYQHTLIAPTGTISLFLDAESTGIEPIYADKVLKKMADDSPITLEPECIKRARAEGKGNQVRCATGLNCVTPKEHIDVVASAQEFCCGGISKTVNLPHEATADEIEKLIYYAWEEGIKAITFYRDGSKAVQPLTTEKKEAETAPTPSVPITSRMRLDQERDAITRKFSVGGEEGYITVGLYSDGSPGEIFIRVSKVGSTLQGFIDQLGISWSLALQHGVPLMALVEKGKGSRFDPSGYTGDDIRYATSIVDYLAKWLESRFLSDGEEEDEEDGGVLEVEIVEESVSYSGPPCKECGGLTQPSGTCYVCLACGETTGCS